MSKRYMKIRSAGSNMCKSWDELNEPRRVNLLKSIGIHADNTLKKLVNLNYIELDSEIRFRLEMK